MTIELKIPEVGESITEVDIGEWLKEEGDSVEEDEDLVELETDKATVELPAPVAGVLKEILKSQGETVQVGDVIAYLDESGNGQAESADEQKTEDEKAEEDSSETSEEVAKEVEPVEETEPEQIEAEEETAERDEIEEREEQEPEQEEPETGPEADEPQVTTNAQRLLQRYGLDAGEIEATGSRGQLLAVDVERFARDRQADEDSAEQDEIEPPRRQKSRKPSQRKQRDRGEERTQKKPERQPQPRRAEEADRERTVPFGSLRRKIARRLVEAQQQAALLTTVNEIDMSAVQSLRSEHGEKFEAEHGVRLGLMSFFVKATVDALREISIINAEIRDRTIVYRDYYHLGIAVATDDGLVVPVLRHAELMSFAQIEQDIADYAARARSGRLKPEELQGGTFTISNGGVYGSLLSTPIVNPPQSGILGMHAIQDRPVARDGEVVIRPMMYVALTYDHRLIDGREAVRFLRHVKQMIESPMGLLLAH